MCADVTIVGAGIVGSLTALLLAQQCPGMSIRLLDDSESVVQAASQRETLWHARVSALSLETATLLRQLGLWDACQTRTTAFGDMTIVEAEGTGHLQINAAALGYSCLGYIAENRGLLGCLQQALQVHSNIEVLWRTQMMHFKILSDRVLLEARSTDEPNSQCSQRTYASKLLIAADGAQSRVRQLACINITRKAYHHQALVCHLKCAKPHLGQAYQVMTSQGPVAFLPILSPDSHWVSLVWSAANRLSTARVACSESAFLAELLTALPECLGSVVQSTARVCYPLQRLHADEYVKDRLVLLGDAAHVIHPLAGLGLNLGVADSVCLANLLIARFQMGLDLGALSGLKRFQRQRKPHIQSVLLLTDQLQQLYAKPMQPGLKVASSMMIKGINQFSALKHLLVRLASLTGHPWPLKHDV